MEQESVVNGFDSTSHEEWKEKIISDLKGKSFEDTLIWEDESGIEHQPFYTKESTDSRKELIQSIQAAQKKSVRWETVQVLNAESENIEEQIKTSSNNGSDFIFLKNTNDFKSFSQIKLKEGTKLYFTLHDLNKDKLPKRFLFDPIREKLKHGKKADELLEKLPTVFQLRLNDLKPDHFVLVDGSIYKNAGASIVQELALTLHHAVEYLDYLTEKGFKAEAAARSLIFKFGYGTSYFSEIAKGRVAHYLIQKVFNAYGVKQSPVIWGEGSTYYHSHKDPYTNLLRLSTQAMSIVLGNCNLISLPSYDEHQQASSMGLRMSKNIPLILKEESFFQEVRDLSSGSYYLESLTCEIAEKAWEEFLKIEEKGGLLAYSESGELEKALQESHERRVKQFNSKERTLLGVNKFQNPDSKDLSISQSKEGKLSSKIISKEIEA